MNVDLVFEGGGVLGINYVGVYKALEEKGYRVNRCAGTSAGSVISALIMAGYTPGELLEILNKTDFGTIPKKTGLGRAFLVGSPLSFIFNKGLYDSVGIEEWVGKLLEKKGVTKFKHIANGGGDKLKIVAADITRRKMLVLPDDLVKYDVDPMEFSVAKAVRMSCTIPFFFTPVEFKYKNSMSYIVDGGLLSGFPIWIFDAEGIPKWPTFGVKIKDPESNSSKGKKSILAYAKDIIDAPLNQDELNFIRHKDFVRVITVEYDGKISYKDFNNVNKHIKDLYENGYKCTMEFLDNWDFRSYVETYRN